MKVESKADLKRRISALQDENTRLVEKAERAQRERWEKAIPDATAAFLKEVNETFPGMVKNPHFEHVDASGYWFTFELENDGHRQTYAVRHTEME